jgi:hypothetical protein
MREIENLPPRPVECQPPGGYCVPRRFGLGTLMAVATAYALVIWGMQQLDWPPVVIIVNAIFLTLIGGIQMAMTKTPRWASIVVGVACVLAMSLFGALRFRNLPSLSEFFLVVIFSLIGGVIYGYLGGALVAGVFLVIDAVARFFSRDNRADRPGSQ